MDEPRAGGRGGTGDRFGAFGLDGVEALAATFEQDADQVDDDIGVARRRLDRLREAHIRLHRMDLADAAERLQISGQFRPAHGDADADSAGWPARAPRGGRGNPSRRTR